MTLVRRRTQPGMPRKHYVFIRAGYTCARLAE